MLTCLARWLRCLNVAGHPGHTYGLEPCVIDQVNVLTADTLARGMYIAVVIKETYRMDKGYMATQAVRECECRIAKRTLVWSLTHMLALYLQRVSATAAPSIEGDLSTYVFVQVSTQ